MSIHSDERRLLDAVYAVRAAFHALDITRPGDKVTIEIPRDAGGRFEMWIRANTKPQDVLSRQFRDRDTHRECEVQGVVLRWPLRLRADPRTGKGVPDPVPEREDVHIWRPDELIEDSALDID